MRGARPVFVFSVLAVALPCAASPIVAGVAGPILGDETGLGGAVGVRGGARTAPAPTRWGVLGEATVLGFAGFGPHTGMDGWHVLAAGEWSRGGRALRGHAFAGATLDHWAREGGEHDEAIDTTVIGGALGLGASWRAVRLDLEATVPVIELERATDSRVIGPQLMLLVSVGRP